MNRLKQYGPVAAILLFVALGLGSCVYSVAKCGFVGSMAYGERAIWAALSGMCDE